MARIIDRISFAIIGALAFALIAVLAGIVDAGPLDPPGTPGSTMKTLDEIPGSWSRNLSATGGCDSPRFDCVLAADQAVLDRTTGLVWERAPSSTLMSQPGGLTHCANRVIGSAKGWRLPSVEELASLVSVGNTNPALPGGHPFSIQNASYWSSSLVPTSTNDNFRAVSFATGSVTSFTTASIIQVWCVRGGAGFEGPR
jgi:hypothetical protein